MRESDRPPAAPCLVREGRGGKQRTCAAPERTDMVASVQKSLVILHPDDGASLGGYKFYAQIDALGVDIILHCRTIIAGEQGPCQRLIDRDADARTGCLHID